MLDQSSGDFTGVGAQQGGTHSSQGPGPGSLAVRGPRHLTGALASPCLGDEHTFVCARLSAQARAGQCDLPWSFVRKTGLGRLGVPDSVPCAQGHRGCCRSPCGSLLDKIQVVTGEMEQGKVDFVNIHDDSTGVGPMSALVPGTLAWVFCLQGRVAPVSSLAVLQASLRLRPAWTVGSMRTLWLFGCVGSSRSFQKPWKTDEQKGSVSCGIRPQRRLLPASGSQPSNSVALSLGSGLPHTWPGRDGTQTPSHLLRGALRTCTHSDTAHPRHTLPTLAGAHTLRSAHSQRVSRAGAGKQSSQSLCQRGPWTPRAVRTPRKMS